ncbi:HAD family hydrolase [Janthinobacterium fluminis]|uniref:HAD family hydrolase n=1 Tax=Janthinobacterium fluminis TaxID=2987524 RepID=A0ABT5K5X7_9BURK|nr:HAD family hydrolase [Janthinobacterium fluminis]MDC8759491.1 HAD family hydrolase [Janthinobacterium fluminis]
MPPIPPKAILFDLDDTLWPIGPVIARAELLLHDWLGQHAPGVARQFSIDALRQRRLALLEERPQLLVDLGELRRIGLLAAFEAAGEDVAKVEPAMALFQAARNAVTPYADVLPGLARLRGRVLLGSISNGVADLDVIGMAGHFTVSLAAREFGRAKPDPAIFTAACAALGVAPAEAVYVGDDLRLDVAGAQNAGMRALWMNRRASSEHVAAGIRPDAICASFDDLLRWLDGHAEE